MLRELNLLGQQRLDIPHIRALQSAVANDFDILAGKIMAGKKAVVVKGFEIPTVKSFIGAPANTLQLLVAQSALISYLASENGSIFEVAADRLPETLSGTNSRVKGAFVSGTVNYIGIDLVREADDTTSDLVMFYDPNLNLEKPIQVPLAKILDYRIVISTSDFGMLPGIAPVCKVTTDSSNNIVLIEDARNLFFRLGLGGTTPNKYYFYPFPDGRKEILTTDAPTSYNVFSGGDKSIKSLKDWMDAVCTRVWEIGGGQYWYSQTADRNVNFAVGGTGYTAFDNNDFFAWDGSNLHWKGLAFTFDNSSIYYNEIADQTTDLANLTDLADGECIYVDIDRTAVKLRSNGSALSPQKATLVNLGGSNPPGSRFIIAHRFGDNIFIRDRSMPLDAMNDHLVKSSRTDGTRVGGLLEKTLAGSGVTLAEVADGNDSNIKKLRITATGDHKVSLSAGDTAGYLSDKLVQGANVTLTTINGQISIASAAADDHLVKATNTDNSPSSLINKIIAGTNVTIGNNGSSITINASGGTSDHLVATSGTDSTADYLGAKLQQGNNITLTEVIVSGSKKAIRIDATAAGSGGTVGGSGTLGYLARWTGPTAIANSIIFDNLTNVGISNDSPTSKLDIIDSGTTATKIAIRSDNNPKGIGFSRVGGPIFGGLYTNDGGLFLSFVEPAAGPVNPLTDSAISIMANDILVNRRLHGQYISSSGGTDVIPLSKNDGTIDGSYIPFSNDLPNLGWPTAGGLSTASRSDHVHALPRHFFWSSVPSSGSSGIPLLNSALIFEWPINLALYLGNHVGLNCLFSLSGYNGGGSYSVLAYLSPNPSWTQNPYGKILLGQETSPVVQGVHLQSFATSSVDISEFSLNGYLQIYMQATSIEAGGIFLQSAEVILTPYNT